MVGRLWRHLLLRDWDLLLLLLLHHGPHSMLLLLLLQLLLLDIHGVLLVGMHLPLLLLLLLHLHLLLHAELVALLNLLHGLHSLLGVHLVQLGLDARGDGYLLLLPWVNHSLLLGLLVLHLDHLWVALLLHQLLLLGVALLDVLLLHVLGRHLLNNLHSLRLRLVGGHGWPGHHVAWCCDWRCSWGKTLLLLRLHWTLLLHWRPRTLGPHRHSWPCHAWRPSWDAGRLRALPFVVVVCPGGVVFLLFLPKLLDDFLHVVGLLGHSVELSFLALVEFTVVLLHIAKLRI